MISERGSTEQPLNVADHETRRLTVMPANDAPVKPRYLATTKAAWSWTDVADWLALLLVALLPWSTSAFSFLAVAFLVAVCAGMDPPTFVRSLYRAPSSTSILFFALALVGAFWSEAGVVTGLKAVGPSVKFLVLPFLFYHFRRSTRNQLILSAFLFSCAALLVYSFIVVYQPHWALKTGRCCGEDYGVPIRNYIDQSQEFGLCLVALVSSALYFARAKMMARTLLASFGVCAFAINLVFVVVSRTAIVCIPFMLAIVIWRHGRWRGVITALMAGAILATSAWVSSPHLRARIFSTYSQYEAYRDSDMPTSVGKRLAFWKKSVSFFAEAPIIGHGSGSVQKLFEQAAVGRSGAEAEVIANPHNQTFFNAIQWGSIGIVVLYVLWLSHLRMFLTSGLIAELGLIVIVQNVVGCLFNSQLSDFTEGWLYVLGVSLAGGMIARRENECWQPCSKGPELVQESVAVKSPG